MLFLHFIHRDSPMKTPVIFGRLLLWALLTAGICNLSVLAQSPKEKDRDDKISEIEKQIKDLELQLKAIKERELLPTPKEIFDGLPESWVSPMRWRGIGPATMGGRITSIAVCESEPTTYWIATASGGLLSTINNAATFEHQFAKEATL